MAELDHGIEDDKQDLRARVQIHEILLNLVHTKVGLWRRGRGHLKYHAGIHLLDSGGGFATPYNVTAASFEDNIRMNL